MQCCIAKAVQNLPESLEAYAFLELLRRESVGKERLSLGLVTGARPILARYHTSGESPFTRLNGPKGDVPVHALTVRLE